VKSDGLMVTVEGTDRQAVTRALRKLKRLVEGEGLLKDVRRRRAYLKPSAKRRRKQRLARQLRTRQRLRQATAAGRRGT